METLVTIGDFSRMTYLSVKALRHYHDIGLLEPTDVDPASGYRLYRPSQVPTAQVIRRFRDLGMPLEEVKAVLEAPDLGSRNRAIVAHLERMKLQLEQTQETVASLRALLETPEEPISVEYRSLGPTLSLAIRDRVGMDDIVSWWLAAFEELHRLLKSCGAQRTGPDGALYFDEFFQADKGEVVAFLPVPAGPDTAGRVERFEVPAAELAVTVHDGPFNDLDKTYGALGTYVAERAIGVEGPIREYYLTESYDTDDLTPRRTEVCWPVFRTTDATAQGDGA